MSKYNDGNLLSPEAVRRIEAALESGDLSGLHELRILAPSSSLDADAWRGILLLHKEATEQLKTTIESVADYYESAHGSSGQIGKSISREIERRAHTESVPHPAADEDVLPSEVDALTARVYDATIGAGFHALQVVRTVGHEPVHLWTHADSEGWFQPVVARRNKVAAAEQIVEAKRHGLIAKMADEDADPWDRNEALQELRRLFGRETMGTDYIEQQTKDAVRQTFAAAMAEVEGLLTTGPQTLPAIRAYYRDRLETVARNAQKNLKNTVSQQGIDNWAACYDQDKALTEIARLCTVGHITLENTTHTIWKKVSGSWENGDVRLGPVDHEGEGDPDTSLGSDGDYYRDTVSGIPNMKAAYEAAKSAIEKVSPLNTPVLASNISARRVTLRAENPVMDPPITGGLSEVNHGVVSLDGSDIRGQVAVSAVLASGDNFARVSYYDFAAEYGGKVRITTRVRNVCGPTDFTLDVDVTANGSIAVSK